MPPKRKRRTRDDADAASVFYAPSAGTGAAASTTKRARVRAIVGSRIAPSSGVPSGIFDEVSSASSSTSAAASSSSSASSASAGSVAACDEVGSVDGQWDDEAARDGSLSPQTQPASPCPVDFSFDGNAAVPRRLPDFMYASQRWVYDGEQLNISASDREPSPPATDDEFEAMLREYRETRRESAPFNRRAAREAVEVTRVNAPPSSPPHEPVIDRNTLRAQARPLPVVCDEEQSATQPKAKLVLGGPANEGASLAERRFGSTELSSRASTRAKRTDRLRANAVTPIKQNVNNPTVDGEQPPTGDGERDGVAGGEQGSCTAASQPPADHFLASLLEQRRVWLAEPAAVEQEQQLEPVRRQANADTTSNAPSPPLPPPPPTVEQLIPQAYRSNMMVERYGFSYNLESVFLVEAVLCLRALDPPHRVTVLVVRDRLGIESYWFPLRLMLKLCGFTNVWAAIRVYCPPDTVKRFDDLRQMYGIQVTVSSTVLYVNEEGLSAVFYANRHRQNIHEIDMVRQGVQHFYRCRRFVVGELIKQLANEYIQWSMPPR